MHSVTVWIGVGVVRLSASDDAVRLCGSPELSPARDPGSGARVNRGRREVKVLDFDRSRPDFASRGDEAASRRGLRGAADRMEACNLLEACLVAALAAFLFPLALGAADVASNFDRAGFQAGAPLAGGGQGLKGVSDPLGGLAQRPL